jgi:prepilin-type N-terminal cleavage/methylation domain-containing protein
MRQQTPPDPRAQEQGFTLIEALVAMVILMFGVAAVANLMVVAGSSNTVANHSTAATAAATQQMELLKSAPYGTLVTGGNITAPVGAVSNCGGTTPVTATYQCNSITTGPNAQFVGVAQVHVRWQIFPPTAAAPNTRFIQVAAESMAPAIGRRSRVLLTTFRTAN